MSRDTVRMAAEAADRALELYEQGISRAAIAERLRVSPKNVSGMMERARARREKAKQEQEA
jgi:transcriptional regulator